MCCDPVGSNEKPNGVCPACGEPTVDGYTTEKCYYSSTICEECENAPCDESC